MTKAGLSFTSPMLTDMQVGPPANPYAIGNPTAGIGTDGLTPSTVDFATVGKAILDQSQFTMPAMRPPPPDIAVDPVAKKFYVQGVVFDTDDASTALNVEELLNRPGTGELPQDGNWQRLSTGSYQQFLGSIRDPSRSRLFKKNFGTGMEQLKQLGGSALQWAGAEELGGRIVENAQTEIDKRAPFQRKFSDIDSGKTLVDWFVATLGTQGPMLLESVAAGLVGAAAGTAAGGPGLGTAGGTLAGIFGRSAAKQKIKDAAAKYASGAVGKDSAEYALLKKASAITGATAASYINGQLIGIGDIYGEMRQQGVDPNDFDSRMRALAYSFPYAIADLVTEFFLAKRVLGAGGRAALPKESSNLRRVTEYGLIRPGLGAATYGAAEGLTETAQEALILDASGQDLTSDEAIARFVESFAAGAAVGGTLGAVANLRSRKPEDLLNPGASPEPMPMVPAGPTAPKQLELDFGDTGSIPAQPSEFPPQLMGPIAPGMRSNPQGVLNVGLGGIPMSPSELIARQNPQLAAAPVQPMNEPEQLDLFAPQSQQLELDFGSREPFQTSLPFNTGIPTPPAAFGPTNTPGSQGVLNVGLSTNPMSRAEILARQTPTAPAPMALPVGEQMDMFAPPALPAPMGEQGALQFAPAAPSGPRFGPEVGYTNPVLQEAMRQAEENAAYAQMQAEREAQKQQEMERLANVGQGQRQVDFAEQSMVPPAPVRRRDILKPNQATAATAPKGQQLRKGQRQAARLQTAADLWSVHAYAEGQPAWKALSEKQQRQWSIIAIDRSNPNHEATLRIAPPPKAVKKPKSVGQKAQRKGKPLQRTAAEQPVQEQPNAVQEPSPAPVPARAKTGTRKGVGRKVPADQTTARKSETDKAQTQKGDGQTDRKTLKRERKAAAPTTEKKGSTLRRGKRTKSPAANEDKTPPAPAVVENSVTAARERELAIEARIAAEKAARDAEKARLAEEARKRAAAVEAARAANTVATSSPAEAWTDMLGDDAPAFATLPEEAQQAWAKIVADNQASQWTAQEIIEQSFGDNANDTLIHRFNRAKYVITTTTSTPAGRIAAIEELYTIAYLSGESKPDKKAVTAARDFIKSSDITISAEEYTELKIAMLEIVNQRQSGIEAVYKTADNKQGALKPWFTLFFENDWLADVTTRIDGLSQDQALEYVRSGKLMLSSLPESTRKAIAVELSSEDIVADETKNGDINNSPALQLANRIKELNGQQNSVTAKQKKEISDALADMYDEVVAAEQTDFNVNEVSTLADYFGDDGQPKINTVKGRLRVVTKVATQKEIDAAVAEQKRADEGRSSRDDGTPITKPLSLGQVRLLVSSFLGKLRIKPKVSLYRNQADLKARNPELYAQAVTSRPQGDFDTVSAVGFAFGDGQVIIFTDRVATERQLRFVLAHETLGHFGFRGLLTPQQLNAALDAIYNTSEKVKVAADAISEALGISRREAVEEYLADYAGTLDTNILAWFWNSIKNFLNKLGVRFDDDMARYFVSQSRRYVRDGQTSGTFVDFKAIVDRMIAIEHMTDPDGSGRYSLNSPYIGEVNHAIAELARGRPTQDTFGMSEVIQRARESGINLADTMERVLSSLKTMNYESRKNLGYRRLYEIIRATGHETNVLRTKYNQMMSTILSPAAEFLGFKTAGVTETQIATVNQMLAEASMARHGLMTDRELQDLGPLVKLIDGEPVVDREVFKKLREMGAVTLEDFKNGFTYTALVESKMTEAKRAELARERDEALDGVTDPQQRADIMEEYKSLMEAETAMYEVEKVVPGRPDLTEKSPEWIMFREVRDTMDESALDLLLANFEATKGEQLRIQSIAKAFLGKGHVFTEGDAAHLKRVSDKFLELREADAKVNMRGEVVVTKEGEAKAQEFIRSWNEALLANEKDKYQKLLGDYFKDAEYDDVVAELDAMKENASIPKSGDRRFAVQQAIQNLAAAETVRLGADLHAKRTIAEAYVPYGREGQYQVRIQVVDPETGEVYKPTEGFRNQLLFTQIDSRAEAERIADNANKMFASANGDGLFDVGVIDNNQPTLKRVKLVAVYETARQTANDVANVNLNDVVNTLVRFGINITPSERSRLVTGLTQQNARARNRLQRKDVPGRDPNTLKFVSQHLEGNASITARKKHRHKIDILFTDNDPESEALWRGSEAEYNRRKAAWEAAQKDPNMPEVLRRKIKEEFIDYHQTFVVGESQVMGNRYKDRGRKLIAFLDEQRDVDQTDFGSGDLGSQLRMFTTFAQLGGSIATGALNLVALTTNVIPAMAGYNNKTGFGGGFGLINSAIELQRAIAQVVNPAQSDVKYWDKLLTDPKALQASGFTRAEAEFMREEIASGAFQAALTNAMLGTARGKITTGLKQKLAKGWMSPFNYTEQASRRAAGLANFRLAYERAIQEGQAMKLTGAELQEYATTKAHKYAVRMVEDTLGDYAMYNRPAMFRGGIQQFLFVYKMFPLNSVLMFANLARKEQLIMLGALMFFSGMKGFPFAEDFMDLIDTIAQWLGLGSRGVWKGSAEKSFMEALDTLAPGLTPVLWRGVFNSIFPGNVADRVSLSNIIPGTGMGLAGADMGREFMEVLGPIASFLTGTVAFTADSVKYGLETAGLKEDTTSLTSIMRESPITMLRAMGDMMAYHNNGAIVNQKGYVVSEDLNALTYITRLTGFYPVAATRENDVVRVASRLSNYQREISAKYRGMYVAAKLAKDNKAAREVVKMVRDWNAAAKGSGLEIPNFMTGANRALREASRTASERYLRSASRAMRPETEQLQYLFDVE